MYTYVHVCIYVQNVYTYIYIYIYNLHLGLIKTPPPPGPLYSCIHDKSWFTTCLVTKGPRAANFWNKLFNPAVQNANTSWGDDARTKQRARERERERISRKEP